MTALEAAVWSSTRNCLEISGQLNFMSVRKLWDQAKPLLEKPTELNIDLKNVTSSNSAGLALLLEWVKFAKERGKKVKFLNMPHQLILIATASGIDKVLGLET